MSRPSTQATLLTQAIVDALTQDDPTPALPAIATLGAILGPDTPLAERPTLFTSVMAYLNWFRAPAPWTANARLSDAYGAVVWASPHDQLIIDLPLSRARNDQLLTDDVREHAHDIIGRDHGIYEPLTLRVLPLRAPTYALALPPAKPLRHEPLLAGRWAFDLTASSLPTREEVA